MPLEKIVWGEVFKQWLGMLRQSFWEGPLFIFRGGYIVHARNEITHRALLRGDWDDLLWIDSDIVPDVNLPTRVAELTASGPYLAPKGGVICGAYYGREYPFEVQLYTAHPEVEGLRFIHPATWMTVLEESFKARAERREAGLATVGGGGTGLMLIRRDVLERMAEFKGAEGVWEAPRLDPELRKRVQAGGDDRGFWTEDVYFCVEVNRRLGIEVLADTDFRFCGGHVGSKIVGPEDYLAAHTMPPGHENDRPRLPKGYEVVQPPRNRAERRALARR
jgi:hypothetical protein